MVEKVTYCGLYCGACPSYQKCTCLGCRLEDKKQNRKSKWACKIRKCCIEKKHVQFCGECDEFPCGVILKKLIESHPDNPRFNYRHKIPENLNQIKKEGLEKWAEIQKVLWSCPDCRKPIIFYHNKCSGCGKECDPQAI